MVDNQQTGARDTLSRREFLRSTGWALGSVVLSNQPKLSASDARPRFWIGYSELRTNLAGGRHANVATMRACVIRADGTERRVLAEELVKNADTWTQFSSWSPDGRQAVILVGSNPSENAALEEQSKSFRHANWLVDCCLFDLETRKVTNVTAVERVSKFNTGVFFWPNNPHKLGFQAIVQEMSQPFSMDLDGRNKKNLSAGAPQYTYGFSAAPDGKRIAYHKGYQIYLADADGSHALHTQTGQPHNFMPQWSPDGQWLMFIAGEHYKENLYVVRKDGTGLKQIAGRHGYKGVVDFLDIPDYHGGSSDVPTWGPDSKWIYFTAKFNQNVELMRVSLTGPVEQLTHSPAGTLHYHPKLSSDGKWVVYGSKRDGRRQLYWMRADGKDEYPITQVKAGWAAMWPDLQERLGQKQRSQE